MNPVWVDIVGSLAAVLSTVCFAPQAWRTIRTRDTRGLAASTYAILLAGNMSWLVYGIALGSWPLIGANIVTGALVGAILALKLRHG